MLRTIIVTLTLLSVLPAPHTAIGDGIPTPAPLEPIKKVKMADYPTLEPAGFLEAPVAVTVAGDWVAQCKVWAKEAGVVLTDSAIQLLDRESDCSPTAQNPTSPACGIAQNINGCGSPGYGYDPISQLRWFRDYCQRRYGGFDGALAHSDAVGWY